MNYKKGSHRGILVLVQCMAMGLLITGHVWSEENQSPLLAAPVPEQIEYENSGTNLEFEKAAENEYEIGALIVLKGSIAEVIDRKYAVIATRKSGWVGYVHDQVLLVFRDEPPVRVYDVVEIYGRYDGVQAYVSQDWFDREAPAIFVDYILPLSE